MTQQTCPLLRLAAFEGVEREQRSGRLAPQRVFVAAEPVERVARQIGQT